MAEQLPAEEENMPYTIVVEGNVGAGKSKFLNNFENLPDVEVIYEQVEEWKNHRGVNLLDLLYKNKENNFISFQMKAYMTQLNAHLKKGAKVKIIERSLHSARYCFIENAKREGIDSVACSLLEDWFEMLIENIPLKVDLIIYLRTSPHIAMARTQGRRRKEEEDLKLEFFDRVHRVHDNWLLRNQFIVPAKVVVIDADKYSKELEPEVIKIMRIIKSITKNS